MLDDLDTMNKNLLRGRILKALHVVGRLGAAESLVRKSLNAAGFTVLPGELRNQLNYLQEKGLITIQDPERETWVLHISPAGTDVIEKNVKAPPGIELDK
ncbi:MAG: hypothetical protein HQM08_17345 [Candidatus Riflebacteria bacterium]|nr:hypothetical protein [Candidatus Riflebacteria bacterium]